MLAGEHSVPNGTDLKRTMDLNNRVAAAIRLIGKTHRVVAEGCGRNTAHVRNAASGKVRPSPELLTYLAEQGIDLNWVFTGRGNPIQCGHQSCPFPELGDDDDNPAMGRSCCSAAPA